jgi:hypothetical protein
LTLFVRHGAWLNAVMEKPASDKSKAQPTSRLEILKQGRKDYEPDMPPVIPEASFLLGYFYEIGPALSTGAGPAVITQQEFSKWQENMGIELRPWQIRLLRQLSTEYIAESNKAAKPECPAPWGDMHKIVNSIHVRRGLRSIAEM